MTELYATPAQKLKEAHTLEAFVETGCYRGAGLQYAKQIGFAEDKLYSCDIDPNAATNCLRSMPSATILPIESISFLKNILPKNQLPTLFWLDAHYPSLYGITDETEIEKMPVFEEIAVIKQLKKNYQNDVIVCDDLRVLADSRNPRYSPGEIPAYYYIDGAWDNLVSILADTHNLTIDLVGEGLAIFTPKA
jgi:hypothetical protein